MSTSQAEAENQIGKLTTSYIDSVKASQRVDDQENADTKKKIKYFNGGEYEGEVKPMKGNLVPHGLGTYTYPDEAYFLAKWDNGTPKVICITIGRKRYVFDSENYDCECCLFFNGETYTMIHPDENVIETRVVRWQEKRKGREQVFVNFDNGAQFCGSILDNKQVGQGHYTFEDGWFCYAVWENGVPQIIDFSSPRVETIYVFIKVPEQRFEWRENLMHLFYVGKTVYDLDQKPKQTLGADADWEMGKHVRKYMHENKIPDGISRHPDVEKIQLWLCHTRQNFYGQVETLKDVFNKREYRNLRGRCALNLLLIGIDILEIFSNLDKMSSDERKIEAVFWVLENCDLNDIEREYQRIQNARHLY